MDRKRCSYAKCLKPTESCKFHTIKSNFEAGGRDWSPIAGMVLCNTCYAQYRARGTLERGVSYRIHVSDDVVGMKDRRRKSRQMQETAASVETPYRSGKATAMADSVVHVGDTVMHDVIATRHGDLDSAVRDGRAAGGGDQDPAGASNTRPNTEGNVTLANTAEASDPSPPASQNADTESKYENDTNVAAAQQTGLDAQHKESRGHEESGGASGDSGHADGQHPGQESPGGAQSAVGSGQNSAVRVKAVAARRLAEEQGEDAKAPDA